MEDGSKPDDYLNAYKAKTHYIMI
jgi:hypothetical protein